VIDSHRFFCLPETADNAREMKYKHKSQDMRINMMFHNEHITQKGEKWVEIWLFSGIMISGF